MPKLQSKNQGLLPDSHVILILILLTVAIFFISIGVVYSAITIASGLYTEQLQTTEDAQE